MRASGPCDHYLHGIGPGAQPEVEREVVLIHVLSRGAALNLAGEARTPAQVNARLRADGGAVDGDAHELDLDPGVRVAGVPEKLFVGYEVQIAVVVEIGPGHLIRGSQPRQTG